MNILFLEDERDLAEPVMQLLRAQRYNVTWVASLEAAYEALAERDYDLAILDVMLPEGEDAGFELAKGIREAGFNGSIMFLTALPSATQLAWILFQEEAKLTEAHPFLLKHLLQSKDVQVMLDNTIMFKETIQQQKPKQLDTWLEKSLHSGITALQTFAEGIKQDYLAVKAALELPWSNGQTEGQVTKLKLIKRQMYGQANFDLLRRRVLLN